MVTVEVENGRARGQMAAQALKAPGLSLASISPAGICVSESNSNEQRKNKSSLATLQPRIHFRIRLVSQELEGGNYGLVYLCQLRGKVRLLQ